MPITNSRVKDVCNMETTDGSNKKKRKSVKNIYTADTGLAIRANLYMIKYIYYHIDKAQCFIDEDELGKKRKSYPVYSTDMFPVSRQRFSRINKGVDFEFTRAEANSITEAYGIDTKYFRKDDPMMFSVEGIRDVDWKCFYNDRYCCKHELPERLKAGGGKKIKESAAKIEEGLKQLAENWEKELKRDDPLFAVCHCFHYGERFDRPNDIESLKQLLSGLDYRKWDNEDMASLNEALQLLKGHYNYTSSLANLAKLRKAQQKKQPRSRN